MAKISKSEKVPKQIQPTFDTITELIDAFCNEHLNAEYAELARQITAALCRKRPSPLVRGRPDVWACGIVHAAGMVNFLFDQSEEPYISVPDLCKAFGVRQSTGTSKSKVVRDLLKINWMDPDWCLPSLLERNPKAWTVSVNGMILDARYLSRSIQELLAEEGLIPYVPEKRESFQVLTQ